jgi:Outer membrane protein beta-barrel domain
MQFVNIGNSCSGSRLKCLCHNSLILVKTTTMKRLIFALTAVCASSLALAQVQFGVKAGVSIVNLIASHVPTGLSTFTTRPDFNAGLISSIFLFKSFYLQPEVVYSGQGGAMNTLFGPTIKLEYKYLNVPVLFKYQHASGLFAETGPQVGFVLTGAEKFNGQSFTAKNYTEPLDFGWAFGFGYKMPMGLGVDARYNFGLTKVIKSGGDFTQKNGVFQFGLFHLFGGKKS